MIGAIAAFLASIYVAATVFLFLYQRDLLYRSNDLDVSPQAVGLPGATVERIITEDGVRLVAWVQPGEGRRLILFLHGNGGSLARRAERIAQLAQYGTVLAIDYRGFGGSGGSPSEEGLLRDAEAAYRTALAKSYAAADVVVLGESLGSGVALKLAARYPVGGVILAGAYESVRAVAAERFWMVPVRWLLKDPFDVAPELGRVMAPVLALHGTEDTVIPLHHAEALFRQARPNVTFVRIEDGPHLVLADPKSDRIVAAWLARLP